MELLSVTSTASRKGSLRDFIMPDNVLYQAQKVPLIFKMMGWVVTAMFRVLRPLP